MGVSIIGPREAANVLRFLSCRTASDDLYFECSLIAARHNLCEVYSFGPNTYHVVMDPAFPVALASEDAVGMGAALLANVNAYNAAYPHDAQQVETADHYAREVLREALKMGCRPDFASAVREVRDIRYNTVDNGGKDHAKGIEGAAEFLDLMTQRAYGLLSEMWHRGEKETW
jgi:hypothetical protein